MDLSERLLHWRKERKWTQQRLAKALGITPAAVCQWEAGSSPRKGKDRPGKRTRPRTQHLLAAVKALGLTMEQFYAPLPKQRKRRSA